MPRQEALGLTGSGIACWSVNCTCLSFLVALEAAAALLHRPDGRYAHILVASSEISSAAVDGPSKGARFGAAEPAAAPSPPAP